MRLDQALAHFKLVPSRSKARELILAGHVEIFKNDEWQSIDDVSFDIKDLTAKHIRISNSTLLKYVSRGGLKLEAALEHCQLNVRDWRCLDVGQSTGGFTDCLLAQGAREVVGFDVGHGQLHETLQQNPKVRAFEGVHIKDLVSHAQLKQEFAKPFELVVIDVSFISLALVFPVLNKVLHNGTPVLALVKPQFELEAGALNKKGVVKNEQLLQSVKTKISELAREHGFNSLDYFPCAIKGTDGNQEYFLHAEFHKPSSC
jgi:23S rRNA (cytidine1920-2'-O)/16S rRNA (cytidine1409-2'-O)-methyltransferase